MRDLKSWEKCLALLDTCDDYIMHPEEYVRPFEVTINGKLRHLVTYKADKKGWDLRMLHTAFASFVKSCYKQASSSYAYAKKKNIIGCLNRHLKSSVFLKTDIHSYFDSISVENMQKQVKKLRTPGIDKNTLLCLTRACFYEDKLPLGFTSSPVLSDLYLVQLDRKYQKNQEIVYTRYADDFLISASGPKALEHLQLFKDELNADLLLKDLTLNQKKTYFRTLKQPGDAIHVLGVNLVKADAATNRITVGDSYLRETSKAICAWINRFEEQKQEQEQDVEVIWGKLSFVKMCSSGSYAKLLRMITVKSGRDGEWIIRTVKNTVKEYSSARRIKVERAACKE